MTRLTILADIHGNLPALEAVIEDMKSFHPDRVIVAGDMVNIGPFSREVIEQLAPLNPAMIRGNHEHYLLEHGTPRAPETRKNWTMPRWLKEKLGIDWFNYLAALPDELTLLYADAPPLRVVHGLPGNPFDAITRVTSEDQALEWLQPVRENFMISGHYHFSLDRQLGRWRVFNPGPVGVPLDGNFDACYLILEGNAEGWHPIFRRVGYDRSSLLEAFKRERFIEHFDVFGYLIVLQALLARPIFPAFSNWHMAHYPDENESIAHLDEFLMSNTLGDYIPDYYRCNLDSLPDTRKLAGSAVTYGSI